MLAAVAVGAIVREYTSKEFFTPPTKTVVVEAWRPDSSPLPPVTTILDDIVYDVCKRFHLLSLFVMATNVENAHVGPPLHDVAYRAWFIYDPRGARMSFSSPHVVEDDRHIPYGSLVITTNDPRRVVQVDTKSAMVVDLSLCPVIMPHGETRRIYSRWVKTWKRQNKNVRVE